MKTSLNKKEKLPAKNDEESSLVVQVDLIASLVILKWDVLCIVLMVK
jgi:hypothetical protein